MELQINDYEKVKGLFNEFEHHISVRGVLEGYVPGRVFSYKDYSSAVIINAQGIFLGGAYENHSFFQEMNEVVKNDILCKLAEEDTVDYVVFYSEEASAEIAINCMFEGCDPMKSLRMVYSNDMSNISGELAQCIRQVDKQLLNSTDMPGLDGVIEEIQGNWRSVDEFLVKGFGCVAVKDDEIIGWCLTDWVVGEDCEIGIETYPDYRNQGYGRQMTLGTLLLAKQKGIKRTGWQCWYDNEGSINTAKASGFELLKEFHVYFGWTNPLNNMLINGNYYMLGKAVAGILPDYERSAESYAKALDEGWDWGGYSVLYWNCACMYYKAGQEQKAVHYYKIAVEKGWNGIEPHLMNPFVYKNEDWMDITAELDQKTRG